MIKTIYHGEYLRMIRKKRGLTLSELSYRTGVSYHTLGNLERGIIDLKPNTEKMISDYFDLGVDRYEEMLANREMADPIKPFTPYMTEHQLITAKPLLDYNTGQLVGDVIPEKLESERLYKLIYK